jgi:hypothetical protein
MGPIGVGEFHRGSKADPNERAHLTWSTDTSGDAMRRGGKVRGHRRPHVTKTDKPDFALCWYALMRGRGVGRVGIAQREVDSSFISCLLTKRSCDWAAGAPISGRETTTTPHGGRRQRLLLRF